MSAETIAQAPAYTAEEIQQRTRIALRLVASGVPLQRTAPIEESFAEPEGPDWQHRASCATNDPEAFFPEEGGSIQEAKKICVECPVKIECLDYALTAGEVFGVWGGLSERERQRLKNRTY